MKSLIPILALLNGLSALKIDLSVGSLSGQITKAIPSGKKYAAFTSIPYAEAPVGKLRFMDPVAKSSWHDSDTLDATKIPPACPQLNRDNPRQMQNPESLIGKEDCLVLNVYVPLDDNDDKSLKDENLPVMIWIHGGAFIGGDGGPDFYGPDYFMAEQDNPVILVTVNYRVGILGFLTLGDDAISGNMGLKDQTLAMRWVQEHISNFGGNPSAVTIFGESAGGISIMAHILSPWSRDLFHRAIVQSGPVSKMLHFSHPPEHYAQLVIESMEFEEDTEELSDEEILQLLQKVPLKQLVAKNALFEKFMFTPNPWKPIVDKFAKKPFMPEDPLSLLGEGSFNKVPIMIGGTQDEGTMYITQFLLNEQLFEEVAQDFDTLGPLFFLGVDEDEVTEQDSATVQIFKNEYLDGLHTNFTKDNWKRISKMFTDISYLVPIDLQARLLQEHMTEPVFYYRYRHKGGLTLPMYHNSYEKISNHDFGVCHADELFVLFRQGSLEHKNEIVRGHHDMSMIKKMVGMWTLFAAQGQPHKDWQSLTKENHQWAILDSKPLKMSWDDDFGQKVEFVRSMFEVLDSYKNMNFQDHPAMKKMMAEKSELENSNEYLTTSGDDEHNNHHDEL